MSSFLGPFLMVLFLATLVLAQEYLIVPDSQVSCHPNAVRCFNLDQLSHINLSNGINLTLNFQPGEHTLTRMLSIHNILRVEMIGQNTASVLILHDRGWIEFADINQLSIEGLTFTGHASNNDDSLLPLNRLNVINTRNLLNINTCSFTGLNTLSQPTVDRLSVVWRGSIIHLTFSHTGRLRPSIIIKDAVFSNNNGRALNIEQPEASIFIENVTFTRNQAFNGGAIFINDYPRRLTKVIINNSNFTNNTAANSGGAFFIIDTGQAIITSSVFKGNNARQHGGGIYLVQSFVSISFSTLEQNKAGTWGGGIVINVGIASIYNSSLAGNSANVGSAMYVDSSNQQGVIINGTIIVENNAETNTIYISQSILTLVGTNHISNNNGSIYFFESQVDFNGPTKIDNNCGISGGAVEAVQSTVHFSNSYALINVSNNKATKYGGGLFLRESSLFVNCVLIISHNTASDGGAIYIYQSIIEFENNYGHIRIFKNVASNNGGGIFAIASSINIKTSVVRLNLNTAGANGGGFNLEKNSRLYIRDEHSIKGDILLVVGLTISNNKAQLNGGGLFINDNSSGGSACVSEAGDFVGECFIQPIDGKIQKLEITHNTAKQLGSAIYGGLLDRCTVSPAVANHTSNGLEYIRRTAKLSEDEHSISSDPLQVELCDSSPSSVLVRKGQPFSLHVKALDQVGNPVNATIHAAVVTSSRVGRLKEGQIEQTVGLECTELEYNVFSEDEFAQVEFYAIGPCTNLGISKLLITVRFLDCTCPLGFHPSESNIKCSCECDSELQATECFPDQETFQTGNMLWVGAGIVSDCNDTKLLVRNCPFDYCVDKPVNISLNSSQQIDRQCAYNRSGILCGECAEGLSLMLATNRCKECSNTYLILLIPFAVAGIALVVLILWLNITVANGSVYSLILYANILAASKAIFLPFKAPNFLTVFVSWVNLDLGIETCFYNGMNSQAKVLLQLAFPAYLFLLMFLIIVLSAHINTFAKILSNRNPVAALCTLLILSYSKLLRMIVAALQFESLPCADNSIIWLYDGNVPYFSQSHIPRFLAAAIIVTACVSFTTLLFFGQWFPRCSNWKIMKWTKNTKYIGFMDAFHAPFTPKHRYWPGLLLFALIVHNLVASIAPDNSVLSAGCIAGGLNVYRFLMNRVYMNKLNSALETIFILNVSILALGTATINTSTGQLALAYVSMAIAFILFVVICCYHFYKYVLKKTNVWNNQVRPLNPARKINFNLRKNRNYQRVGEIDDNDDVELPAVVDMYNYGQGPREETDPIDKYITPPIIRPATRPDQLREPDLDILAPITEDDYRQATPIPQAENCPRPVVTCTVVEISKDNYED